MKNFKNLITIGVTSILLFGAASAQETEINKIEIQNQASVRIETAMSELNKPIIEQVARVQLDEIIFKQNVEQFLRLAKFNEEPKKVNIKAIAE